MMDVRLFFLGPTNVGKTSILEQLNGKQTDKKTESTIGVSYYTKEIELESLKLNLELWDMSGQDRFKDLIEFYLAETHRCFMYMTSQVLNLSIK